MEGAGPPSLEPRYIARNGGRFLFMVTEDQVLGCILGGALGDALGGHFEGLAAPVSFFVPSCLRVSDDTQMTLATCESIAANRSVDPESIARSFLGWFRTRRFIGLGASTLKALTELDVGGHWATVGAVGERAAGNGAAMRIAPLAFVLDPDCDDDRRTIRDVCRITHRNDEAYVGGLAIIRSLRWVMQVGRLDQELIQHLAQALPDSKVRDRFAAILEGQMSAPMYAERFGTSGYVADSVPFAVLIAVVGSRQPFMDAMRTVVESGGDTDTIGSIVGQIRGACFGVGDVPPIVESIDDISTIREVAAGFVRAINAM